MADSLKQRPNEKVIHRSRANKRTSLWKRLVMLLFVFFWVGVASFVLLLLYLRTQPLPDAVIAQTSQIYDLNDELIDRFYVGENREVIPLAEMSPHVVNATLAIEDARFYKHFGLDMKGIARAVWVNVAEGRKAQGASTLTQQLARNLYLSFEKTWDRKFKEALYALQLEMRYSKDEILQYYLNEVYYGHSTYGIEAAAKLFFAKSAKDLTLAESALLAGVPKGPRYFSPYYDEENAKSRQLIILQEMVKQGHITQQEADEAAQQPLHYIGLSERERHAPYFVDYVKSQAKMLLDVDESTFIEGGYRIYTTLDLRTQQVAEEAIDQRLEGSDLQAALIAIDPRTGQIRSMVGGANYEESQYNRVFTKTRQPGSSFKPFVYLTALENHAMTPVSQVMSQPTVFTYDEGRYTYSPHNFGQKYSNEQIDMRQAIAESDNIYAVHTMLEIGMEDVIDMAQRLGITSEFEPLPSLALGTFPVSPYEMAAAFGTIANQGERVKPTAILKIEDHAGNVLYEAAPESEQVIEPAYTYVLTSLMQSVFEPGGTGYRIADQLRRPVAAKTGTTNADAWMVGFTPELSTAVWVGYDQGKQISAVESYLAAPIFSDFMVEALEPIPPKIFPVPAGIVTLYIDPVTGKRATAACPDARMEVFVKGTEPTELCASHPADETGQTMEGEMIDEHKRSWWDNLKRWWTE